MKYFKHNFIKSRYGVLPFIAVLLVFFIVIFVFIEGEKREILHTKNLQDTGREAEIVTLMIKDALTKGDYVAVENFISSWGEKRNDIMKATVVSKNNFIIGSYSSPYKAVEPHPMEIKLNYGDGKQATLKLIIDDYHITDLFYKTTLKLFFSVLLVFLMAGFFIWRVLGVTAFRPLENEIKLRKQYEKESIDAKNIAESANNAKSEFLSRMSHELRTPLNAIIGFSQLLEIDCTDEDRRGNLNEISAAGKHLLGLINDILELSKIEAGHIEVSLDEVSIYDLIECSFAMVSGLAHNRQIQLVNQLEGKKNIYVLADKFKLNQVFINLISNAIKYNKENGQVKISITELKGERVKINFTDTGNGLSEEQQLCLFQSFKRLGAEHSNIEGSGIGLVITRKLIGLMGGEIGVDSEIGKGSTFWIILPLIKSKILSVTKNDIQDTESKHLVGSINKTVKDSKKVLYIEDNPANTRLIESTIDKFTACDCYSAVNGYDGVEKALKLKPDLILLDIDLPDINGYEVFKKLREYNELTNTPVVAVSANAMRPDIDKALDLGFFDYVTKPIDISTLINIVNKVVTNKEL